jgi:arginyl-tRNA synthetase
MPTAVDPVATLAERIERALVAAFGPELAGTDPVLRRSTHADYQSNVALALKGRVAGAPRDLAAKIVAAADLEGVCDAADVAGPGFINLRLCSSFLAARVRRACESPRLGVEPAAAPEVCVVDYSAPNVAKEMHVGHIRSTILGDAVCRVLELCGHRVIRQNHLGDWGTQFGMLIEHMLDTGLSESDAGVGDLNDFYREARKKFDASPEFADRARARVVKLQGGDETTLALWRKLVGVSVRYLYEVYARLGVLLQEGDVAAESFFNPRLAGVVQELEDKALARVDDGALCVFPPGFTGKGGAPLPLIVRKRDGGYGYATTDLAAIKYRLTELHGTRLIYVVGAPQAQHLAMIFKTAEVAGWLAPPARAEHVAFGSILGPDGKMFKARSGETVRLLDLLDEAEERALPIVRDKSPDLDEEAQRRVARAVGVGAIKYVDLSSDRIKDYVFDWNRLLATEGNSGPYLMYAHARSRSILRKAGASPDPAAAKIEAPEERALAIALLSFGSAVGDVARTLEPHRLCTYLYDLATTFSAFYDRCPVLRAEGPDRAARLVLCELTARTLALGLGLLGIEAPERM